MKSGAHVFIILCAEIAHSTKSDGMGRGRGAQKEVFSNLVLHSFLFNFFLQH